MVKGQRGRQSRRTGEKENKQARPLFLEANVKYLRIRTSHKDINIRRGLIQYC